MNVGVRVPPDQLAPLDAYIADQPEPRPGRPEAIRAILADWLAGRGYLAETIRPPRRQAPRRAGANADPTSSNVPAAQPEAEPSPLPMPVPAPPSAPYEPSEPAIERIARLMCAGQGGGDPDVLDGKGVPMWRRFHAGARAGLLKQGHDL